MPILPKVIGIHSPVVPATPPRTIAPVATSVTAFLGRAFSLPHATPPQQPTAISSFLQFESLFGGLSATLPLTYAVRDFFNNGGTQAIIAHVSPAAGNSLLSSTDLIGSQSTGTGLYQLASLSLFNILCIPPDTFTTDIDPAIWNAAATYCQQRRAMLIVNPPHVWTSALKAGNLAAISTSSFNIPATAAQNAAVYLPNIVEPDPLHNEQLTAYAPCGAIAGLWARTDTERGVWKAPAGISAALQGVSSLEAAINDQQTNALNPLGINCLRAFSANGELLWGARTLAGSDTTGSEYKYIPIRRLALFIEESLYQGTQWVAFEPNAEPLWAQLRLSVGAFLQKLFLQGAFQGTTPAQAYFVKCDSENNTPAGIANGVVNITVGFAPLQPAEFIVIQIQQLAGQSAS
jgi:phage tail sheath protein FI